MFTTKIKNVILAMAFVASLLVGFTTANAQISVISSAALSAAEQAIATQQPVGRVLPFVRSGDEAPGWSDVDGNPHGMPFEDHSVYATGFTTVQQIEFSHSWLRTPNRNQQRSLELGYRAGSSGNVTVLADNNDGLKTTLIQLGGGGGEFYNPATVEVTIAEKGNGARKIGRFEAAFEESTNSYWWIWYEANSDWTKDAGFSIGYVADMTKNDNRIITHGGRIPAKVDEAGVVRTPLVWFTPRRGDWRAASYSFKVKASKLVWTSFRVDSVVSVDPDKYNWALQFVPQK